MMITITISGINKLAPDDGVDVQILVVITQAEGLLFVRRDGDEQIPSPLGGRSLPLPAQATGLLLPDCIHHKALQKCKYTQYSLNQKLLLLHSAAQHGDTHHTKGFPVQFFLATLSFEIDDRGSPWSVRCQQGPPSDLVVPLLRGQLGVEKSACLLPVHYVIN